MLNILVVDDDPYTLKLFEKLFKTKELALKTASSGLEARALISEGDYNLILMDQRLPDARGLEILKEVLSARPLQVAILMTGYAEVSDAIRAVREGLFDYITKPFEKLESLESLIEKALELDRAYREIQRLRKALDQQEKGTDIIGQSPVMQAFREKIAQVAPLDATVLLEGESGTGKSLAAKYLHDLSRRTGQVFLVVNCGGLSEQLLESALFGYERGAFTGAMRTTPGYFERADGGTLFFDEISNMSDKMQCSLLQVLQERTFSRIGSPDMRSSDFRLVFATNKRLSDEVNSGRFREDLFYRINVVTIEVPSLRDRKTDIVLLSLHLLEQFNARFGKKVGPLTPDAIAALEGFSWPGNVRQLQHTIERLVALHPGGPISASQVIESAQMRQDRRRKGDDAALGGVSPYQEERARFEAAYLSRLLKTAGGNISEAARISGVPRQNLYLRMKKWGTKPEG